MTRLSPFGCLIDEDEDSVVGVGVGAVGGVGVMDREGSINSRPNSSSHFSSSSQDLEQCKLHLGYCAQKLQELCFRYWVSTSTKMDQEGFTNTPPPSNSGWTFSKKRLMRNNYPLSEAFSYLPPSTAAVCTKFFMCFS